MNGCIGKERTAPGAVPFLIERFGNGFLAPELHKKLVCQPPHGGVLFVYDELPVLPFVTDGWLPAGRFAELCPDFMQDSLSSADSAQVTYIAGLCPNLYGAVVYKARTLYTMVWNDPEAWDDDLACGYAAIIQTAQEAMAVMVAGE